MKVETYIVMSRDEIYSNIPYQIIAETMCGSRWDTGKRKRMMKERFTETEIDAIYRIKKHAYSWCLVKGVPEELRITPHILALWHKLANFCYEI